MTLEYVNEEVKHWLCYEGQVPPLTSASVERATGYNCGALGRGPSERMQDFLTQHVLMCPLVETQSYALGIIYGRKTLFGRGVAEERVSYETATDVPIFSRSMLLKDGSVVVSQTAGVFVVGSRTLTYVSIAEPKTNLNFRTLDMVYLDLDCKFCARRDEICNCPSVMRDRSFPITQIRSILKSCSAWDVMLSFIANNCGGWGWMTPCNRSKDRLRIQTSMTRGETSFRSLQIKAVQELLGGKSPPRAMADNTCELLLTDKNQLKALPSPIISAPAQGSSCRNVVVYVEENSGEVEKDDKTDTQVTDSVAKEDVDFEDSKLIVNLANDLPKSFVVPISSVETILSKRTKDTKDTSSIRYDKETSTCGVCGVVFSRRYDTKRHILNVHYGEKRFKCRLCRKTFAQRGHLNVHVNGVHGERNSFECSYCGKNFSWRHNYKRHVEKAHSAEALAEMVHTRYVKNDDSSSNFVAEKRIT